MTYIMESPHEAQRLLEKVDGDAWVQRYLSHHVGPHSRILEVGCGPGGLLAALARRHPFASFTGVDVSIERLCVAADLVRGGRTTFARADAAALPFADGSFDLVYTRFLMEYVADKLKVIAEMARVVRTGGVVIMQDLDGQLVSHYPPDPEIERDLARTLECLASTGFDVWVGRKLFTYANEAGLQELRVAVEPYHLIVGAISAADLVHWRRKFEIIHPVMARALGGEAEAQRAAAAYLRYLARPDSLTFSTLFTVTGLKRTGRPEGNHPTELNATPADLEPR